MINKPKVFKRLLITGGVLLAFAGTSFAKHATTVSGDAANGVMNSRHNLAKSGSFVHVQDYLNTSVSPSVIKYATTETCVFCHTPHFTNKGSGPLWNRNMAGGPIQAYGSTIAGNNDGNTSMFSTLACLSCHDGVTTFDSIINRPGAGLGTGDQGWAFQMKNTFNKSPDWDHFVSAPGAPPVYCNNCHGAGSLHPGVVEPLVVGDQVGGKTNLANDHPIGVVYRGAGDSGESASLRARSTVISSINLDIEKTNGSSEPALVAGNLWAVKGFVTDSATIQDLLRSPNGSGSGNYVQCASCHDVHYKNLTNPEKDFYEQYGDPPSPSAPAGLPVVSHASPRIDGLFLRRVGGNSDSGVCRTCHNK